VGYARAGSSPAFGTKKDYKKGEVFLAFLRLFYT